MGESLPRCRVWYGSPRETDHLPVLSSSDIPSHAYQLSWDFNHAWSTFYASGPEILRYWQQVAAKYDVMKYIRFSHNVVRANWNEATAKWEVTVVNSVTGEQKVDQADALVTAVGILNQWTWPSIPGLKNFRGKLMHSAAWDENFQAKVGLSLVSASISMNCSNLNRTKQSP